MSDAVPGEDGLKRLKNDLVALGEGNILEVLGVLLRFVQERRPDLQEREAFCRHVLKKMLAAVEERKIPELSGVTWVVSGSAAAQLLDVARGAVITGLSSRATDALAARTVCERLATITKPFLASAAAARPSSERLVAGAAWYVGRPPLSGAFPGQKLSSRPSNQDWVWEALDRVVLVPDKVTIETHQMDATFLEVPGIFGVILPAGETEVLLDKIPTDAFVNARIGEVERKNLADLVPRADADVLVLPELCDPRLHPVILDKRARIVVWGSRHEEDAEGWRNRATMSFLLPDRVNQAPAWADVTLEKMSPFSGAVGLEYIESDRVLHIVRYGSWTVTALVCKDFLNNDILDVLRRLQVSIVLVAAWSPKTDAFVAGAADLSARGQGIVVIANHDRVDTTAKQQSTPPARAVFSFPISNGSVLAPTSVPKIATVVRVATSDPGRIR